MNNDNKEMTNYKSKASMVGCMKSKEGKLLFEKGDINDTKGVNIVKIYSKITGPLNLCSQWPSNLKIRRRRENP